MDVISIVGMGGAGKTTLADRVYNERCIVDHFDVRAWGTVGQERNEKKLLQKIYNQVIGLKERCSEDDIDDEVADKLRKQLFGKRYLIVLDDLWDTTTWDELTRPFPPVIWSLAKLRDMRIVHCSLFDPCINEPIVLEEDFKLENLRTLYLLCLPSSEDTEDIFKRFPNLQMLRVEFQLPNRSGEKICFPRFDVLNELEELCLKGYRDSFSEYTDEFPSSLKELHLRGINLTSDSLSRIARLPNLQKLCLREIEMEGEKEWNMEEVIFQNLISLTLNGMSFSKWQVDGEKSFPVLEELEIRSCRKLIEIPESFGDIASLKSILIVFGSCQLEESALNIQQYIADMMGEDKLQVQTSFRYAAGSSELSAK